MRFSTDICGTSVGSASRSTRKLRVSEHWRGSTAQAYNQRRDQTSKRHAPRAYKVPPHMVGPNRMHGQVHLRGWQSRCRVAARTAMLAFGLDPHNATTATSAHTISSRRSPTLQQRVRSAQARLLPGGGRRSLPESLSSRRGQENTEKIRRRNM